MHDLKRTALSITEAAIATADAGQAVRSARHLFSDADKFASVYAIAIGKAASPMAQALEEILPGRIERGILSGYLDADSVSLGDHWQMIRGGHPLPTEESFRAGKLVLEMLDSANSEDSLVVFLISGGGSAMVESGIDGVSDADIIAANEVLTTCGADIAEINAIRKTFSAIKGGKLAAKRANARQITLIISDTEPGDEASVSSGPTFPQRSKDTTLVDYAFAKYGLADRLPGSIVRASERFGDVEDEPAVTASRSFHTLLDNEDVIVAASKAALALGFDVVIAKDLRQQNVGVGVSEMLRIGIERLDAIGGTVCVISGGEFACPVRGDGVGGRNSESVLRMAIELDKESHRFSAAAFASVGTDGIDGNSPAAGAVCDDKTIERAASLGLAGGKYLDNSDALTFFEKLGDAVVTGPTFTNVRDIRVLLLSK